MNNPSQITAENREANETSVFFRCEGEGGVKGERGIFAGGSKKTWQIKKMATQKRTGSEPKSFSGITGTGDERQDKANNN